jgi:hypothetical protein
MVVDELKLCCEFEVSAKLSYALAGGLPFIIGELRLSAMYPENFRAKLVHPSCASKDIRPVPVETSLVVYRGSWACSACRPKAVDAKTLVASESAVPS